MKHIHKFTRFVLPFATFCLLLSSCVEDEAWSLGDGAAVRFRGAREGVARTTGGGDAWTATDEVGIFLVKSGKTMAEGVVAGAENVKYRVVPDQDNASAATFTPGGKDTIYFPAGKVDAVGYYPWRAAVGKGGTLAVDVTGQSDPAAIDVLHARTGDIDKAAVDVPLVFKHVMSKMVLNVKAGSGLSADDIKKVDTKAVIHGVPGSATVSLQEGTVTAGAVSARPIELHREAVPTAGFAATYSGILVPGDGAAGRSVVFTVNGGTYTWDMPDATTFPAGTCYTYKVSIDRTGIAIVDSPTITPWTNTATPVTKPLPEAGIYTAAELVEFSNDWNAAGGDDALQKEVIEKWSGTPDGIVCLRADIDMTGVEFTPIGLWNNQFRGEFDGRGHVIRNLKVSATGNYAGLFGESYGTIRDVVLEGCEVEVSGKYSGGIAGYNGGTITGCIVRDGTVKAGSYGGGICGGHGSGKITGCIVANGLVMVNDYGGGICGEHGSGEITGCIVTNGTVEVNNRYSGGISGYVSSGGRIDACKVTGGTVIANGMFAGGIGGRVSGTIWNCIVTDGTVIANGSYAGGIGGDLSGEITGCMVRNGRVTATNNSAGGICGQVSGGKLGGCIATGVVVEANISSGGGICGLLIGGGTIVGSIAAPWSVTTKGYTGVCVGRNNGSTITACYGVKIGGLDNVGGNINGVASDCMGFDAKDVGAPGYFFTKQEDQDTPSPIDRMNEALKSVGLKVEWVAGNAESGWYPVPLEAKN